MVPIPYALFYTFLSSGSVVKTVRCENCSEEYHYTMTRQEEGDGTSLFFLNIRGARMRAYQKPKAQLEQELEISCDAVPCPWCGWYQRHIVARIRQLRWQWMKTVGWLALLPAAACLLMGFAVMTLYTADEGSDMVANWLKWTGILLGTSLAMFLIRYVGARLHNPNAADVTQRQELGQRLTLNKVDFLKKKESEPNHRDGIQEMPPT